MKGFLASVCGVVVLFSISSCVSIRAPAVTQLRNNSSAFVKGMDSSGFSLGSTFDVQIESVDGNSKPSSWTGYSVSLEIPSGTHHLVVRCMMVAEMGNVSTDWGESGLDVNLVAGHVYQLQPYGRTTNGGCGAKIDDVIVQR